MTAAGLEFFEKQVRPLLVKRAMSATRRGRRCPRGAAPPHPGGWVKGGDSGPAVVPASPDKSLLIDAVRYGSLEMPPRGKLPAPEIAALERWVSMDRRPLSENARSRPVPTTSPAESARSHWAFRPIADAPVPCVKDAGWPRSDVDRFILAKLEEEGLSPVADADKRRCCAGSTSTWLACRRPRTRWRHSSRTQRPTRLRDGRRRLLARPAFGERWGRHWLDVARYADSNGSDENFTYLRCLALSQLRDRRVQRRQALRPVHREQIAGDLLPAATSEERDEQLIATGFLVLGPKVHRRDRQGTARWST